MCLTPPAVRSANGFSPHWYGVRHLSIVRYGQYAMVITLLLGAGRPSYSPSMPTQRLLFPLACWAWLMPSRSQLLETPHHLVLRALGPFFPHKFGRGDGGPAVPHGFYVLRQLSVYLFVSLVESYADTCLTLYRRRPQKDMVLDDILPSV